MKFKTGDVVEVQGVVKWDDSGDGKTYLTIASQTVGVPTDAIVLVHQGFKVGDVATYQPTPNLGYEVTIVALHELQAWVQGDYEGIVDLYELKRPEPEEPEEMPEQPPEPPQQIVVVLSAADEALDPRGEA